MWRDKVPGWVRETGRSSLSNQLRGWFAIDTRSLAAFRILIGIILVVDILLRLPNFHFFYTDLGAVPVELAVTQVPIRAFSLYYLSGDPLFTAFLFLLQVVTGILLVVGWRTRTMAVAAFLLAVSLDHRNPLVTSTADTLLRHLLFFAMFLPMGERWSLDSLRREERPREVVATLASALILLQVVLMYTINGYLKLRSAAWRDGSALPVILAHDSITFFMGDALLNLPLPLLQFAALLWMYIILFSVLLILLPGWPRVILTAVFMGVHLMLAISVRIGEFSFIAIAGLLLFLPREVWDGWPLSRRAASFIRDFREDVRNVGNGIDAFLPRFPSPGGRSLPGVKRAGTFLVVALLVVVGADMFIVSAEVMGGLERDAVPLQNGVDRVKTVFGIEQPAWSVFAPLPSHTDEWFVVAVEPPNGLRIDLHNERLLRFERPGEHLNRQWDTYRERFYWENLFHPLVAEHYRDYLCRGGDPIAPDVAYITVYMVIESIDFDRPETLYTPSTRERRIMKVYTGACGDRNPKTIGPDDGTWS